jgi:hypothetical protein
MIGPNTTNMNSLAKKIASSEPEENFGELALLKKEGRSLLMPHIEISEMPEEVA